jgi:predicted nucleic acid-binding protein
MMTADTNIFIYSWDSRFPGKATVAQEVGDRLKQRESAIGLQVVGEVQHVLSRKFRQPPWEAAQNARNLLASFGTFAPVRQNAEEALSLMAAGRFQYWDALLLTAARDAGCTVFFSEDMGDGTRLGALEVVNPFGPDGMSERARALLGATA